MRRAALGPVRDVVLIALLVTVGLQTLRAFLPLVVHLYGTQPGISSLDMGRFAVSVILLAWILPLLWRLLGRERVTRGAAALLLASRLLSQFVAPDQMLPLAAFGVVAFLWTIPGVFSLMKSDRAEASAAFGLGVLLGPAVDAALSGAYRTWDLVWQRSPAAVGVAIVPVLVAVWLLGRPDWQATRPEGTEAPAPPLLMAGLGPLLFLHLLVFQNTARLGAITGWELPVALAVVLLADLGALALAARLATSGTPRYAGLAAGIGVAVLLVPAQLTGILAAGAIVLCSMAAAVVLMTLCLARAGGGSATVPSRWTAPAWALGMLAFGVFTFVYYVGYDIRVPFENNTVPLGAALISAVLAFAAGRSAAPATPRAVEAAISSSAMTAGLHSAPWGAALLLVAPLLLALAPVPPPVRAAAGWPVRVMSYNVHQGYGMDGRQDLEAVAAAIEGSGAEVVALQEISRGWVINGSTDLLAWFAHRLRMSAVWAPAADAVWGNALLSRRPVLASGRAALPRGGVPMRRSMVWAEIDLGAGERLLAIGVHFHHVEADSAVRLPQAVALAALWNGRPRTVVMGDLNASPDAGEIAVLRQAGLRDAFLLTGKGEGFTYRAGQPDRRIDYIWISPDLTARDFQITGGLASDHLGIAVTVAR